MPEVRVVPKFWIPESMITEASIPEGRLLEASTSSLANSSCPWEDLVEAGLSSPLVSLSLLAICLATLLANCLLAGVILPDPSLRQRRCNMFMLSIGCADMANSIYLLVFCQPGINSGRFIEAIKHSPSGCLGFNIVGNVLLCAPWYNFLGLNLDRLYAIKWPYHYKAHMLDKAPWPWPLVVCWCLSILPSGPLWLDTSLQADIEGGCTCYFPLNNTPWVLWSSSIAFILPTCLILLIWIAMAQAFLASDASPTSSRLRACTLKLVAITMLFLASVAPFSTVFTLSSLQTPENTRWLDITLPVTLLNSMVQPAVYICIDSELRKKFLSVYGGLFQGSPTVFAPVKNPEGSPPEEAKV